MVDVWRVWSAETPGLRPSVNDLMRRAYRAARAMDEPVLGSTDSGRA